MLAALGLLTLFSSASCEKNTLRLNTPKDFVDFMNSVNSGTDYKRTTVFLDATLDLSEYQGQLSPIGINYTHQFAGTFDGQGFALGYFTINATEKHAGLFGYSKGATIKNIVVSMTGVMNVASPEDDPANAQLYAGGIIGRCEKIGNPCIIENSVNIANVTYTGSASKDVYLGGIAGFIKSKQGSFIKNCANYGMIANLGQSETVEMGGIVGFFGGSSSKNLKVHNCLNLGPLVFNSALSDSWYVGGIAGNSEMCIHDNCVSAGKIITKGKDSGTIGSLSGKSTYAHFINCYWTEAAGNLTLGTETEECASYNSDFVLDNTITAGNYTGNRLLDALNTAVDYYVLYDYSHWGYSTGKFGVDFTIDGRTKHFDLDKQLLLLPGLSSDGPLTFDGWYSDEGCTKYLDEFIFRGDSEVYGKWRENTNTYTITFDTRGGTPVPPPITGTYNSKVVLPSTPAKGDCMLGWWENDYGDMVSWDYTIPAHNVTLHALWGCVKISSASDLVGVTKVISSGTSYKAVTVTLENDIEFTSELSEQFEPIGADMFKNFEGIFDGRGHTIRNLKIKTAPVSYGGLFGYSKGAVIRNLVMDSSCSVVSRYGSLSGDVDSFFGAFIGYCETTNGHCSIENSVNMAPILFEGQSSSNVFIGGFAGRFYGGGNYGVSLKNVVNYGTITYTGTSKKYVNVGGIIGGCTGESNNTFFRNCMNYGAVTCTGRSRTECVGGLGGYVVNNVVFENCVSAGGVRVEKTAAYIGSIAGEMYSDSVLRNCYWDKKIGFNPAGLSDSTVVEESTTSYDDETFELAEEVSVRTYKGTSLVKALNGNTAIGANAAFARWALNRDGHKAVFVMNEETEPFVTLSSQIILLPSFTDSGNESFYGWFLSAEYKTLFSSDEITEDITLYGMTSESFEIVPKDKDKSGSNSGVIIAIVFVCVIMVIVVAFIVWNGLNHGPKSRGEAQELEEPILSGDQDSSVGILDLYPEGYTKPTLENALVNAGVEGEKAAGISSMCYRHAEKLMEEKKLPKGVTLDDAAAIALYTMEADTLKQNSYRMINEALLRGGPEAVEPVKDLLYLVVSALRRMPTVYNKTLYRGVRGSAPHSSSEQDGEVLNDTSYPSIFNRGMEFAEDDWTVGREVMWPTISSASPSASAAKEFLERGPNPENEERFLFVIEKGWGYNIQSCSMSPREEEIVMEPERVFRVKSVSVRDGVTTVKMETLNTPLIFSELFGSKDV